VNVIALVTGANKGLGKETARLLALRGMTVLLGSRDLERGTAATRDLAAGGVTVEPIRLDVTDPKSVEAVAARIQDEYGRLDVLVNNAGILVDASATELTAAQLRETFEVNVFGVVTAIQTLLPLLRRSAAPRIVNVSSTTGSLTMTSESKDFGGDADRRIGYATSKTALNMLTVQYARAFARNNELIKINSVTPGFVATDMNQHRGTRTVTQGAAAIVDLATLQDDGPTGGFFNDQGPVPW
jgi:NAD(P)-dependent dehydrogenase (short-subunit alcohol dehydrogenase family)